MVDVIYYGVGDKCKLVVVKNSLVFVMSSKIVFFHNGSFFYSYVFAVKHSFSYVLLWNKWDF